MFVAICILIMTGEVALYYKVKQINNEINKK